MIIFLCLIFVDACRISSVSNGNCVKSANVSMDFCEGLVAETICLQDQFPEWNWTALDKEVAIRQAFLAEVEKIVNLEAIGIGGEFSTNEDCTNTLKAIMCQINFPFCVNDTSYAVCGRGCEYLRKNCLTYVDVCQLSEFVVPNVSYCTFGTAIRVSFLFLLFGY